MRTKSISQDQRPVSILGSGKQFKLLLILGLMFLLILSACGGDSDDSDDDNDNATSEVTTDNNDNDDSDSSDVDEDQTPTPEGADDTSDADTDAQSVDDATEEPEDDIETADITVYWQADGFVLKNTSEVEVNIFGIALNDGNRNTRLFNVIPSNLTRQLQPGQCILAYERGAEEPAWATEICDAVDGSEGMSTINFIWMADSFDVNIRNTASPCVGSEGECTVRVPIGQEVGR